MSRKSKRNGIYWIALAFLIIGGAGTYCYLAFHNGWYPFRSSWIYYKDFHVRIPPNYTLHGMDISRYQSWINWKQVSEINVSGIKIDFVLVKATEGSNYKDILLDRNWREASQYPFKLGVYHYLHPAGNIQAQADFFIKNINLKKGNLAPVIDIEVTEELNKKDFNENVLLFAKLLEKKFGVKPIIYTYADFYAQNMDTTLFNDYPLWVAHYYTGNKPRTNREFQFWQFTDDGRVNGIKGPVDLNVFNGKPQDLNKYCLTK